MDNMKTGARVYRVKDYTTEIRLKWKYSCNYTLLPKHFSNQLRLENLWEEISFENAHSRTVSSATNEDFFIARTIKGHNSAKLSAETSTTGTFSKRADIFPRETPKPPGVIGECSGKTWGEQCSRVEGTKMAVRNHQAKFAWKKLVIS